MPNLLPRGTFNTLRSLGMRLYNLGVVVCSTLCFVLTVAFIAHLFAPISTFSRARNIFLFSVTPSIFPSVLRIAQHPACASPSSAQLSWQIEFTQDKRPKKKEPTPQPLSSSNSTSNRSNTLIRQLHTVSREIRVQIPRRSYNKRRRLLPRCRDVG